MTDLIKKSAVFLFLTLLGSEGAALAGTVNFNADMVGPEEAIWSVLPGDATGFNMGGGMTVTVNFTGGTSVTVNWVSGFGGCGSASGAAGNGTWRLSECNSSSQNPWVLTNSSTNLGIASVVLNGDNNVIFDRDLASCSGNPVACTPNSGGQTGTPGSGPGITYTQCTTFFCGGDVNRTVNVTYENEVTLAGLPSNTACTGSAFSGNTTGGGCGDEWGNLAFSFSSSFLGSRDGAATWGFFQDTDLAGTPEPLSFGLVGIGLLGIGLCSRKRGQHKV